MYISALSEKLSASLCRGSITNLNFALGFCGMCDDVSEPYTPAHSYVRCPGVQHIYAILGGIRLHTQHTIITIWQGRALDHFPRQTCQIWHDMHLDSICHRCWTETHQLKYHANTEKKTTIQLTVPVDMPSEKMVGKGVLHAEQTFWSPGKMHCHTLAQGRNDCRDLPVVSWNPRTAR